MHDNLVGVSLCYFPSVFMLRCDVDFYVWDAEPSPTNMASVSSAAVIADSNQTGINLHDVDDRKCYYRLCRNTVLDISKLLYCEVDYRR